MEVPSRAGSKMVVDTGNNRVLLFGGNTLGESQVFYDDTWEYSPEANTWTQILVEGPSSRGSHSMAYNPDESTALLFGGQTPTGRLSDTWMYDCETESWAEVVTETSPEGRSEFDMIYDSSNGVFIFNGGWGDRSGLQDDTWVFNPDTNTWTEIETDVNPGRMYGHSLEYDPVAEDIILYGGHVRSPISNDYIEEVWRFNLDETSWVQTSSVNTPHGRYWNAEGYSTEHNALVVFGGTYGVGAIDETLVLDTQSMEWAELNSFDSPSRRVISDMVYVESMESFLLFGGVNNSYVHFNDLWKLSPDTWEWDELHPSFSSRGVVNKTGVIPGFPVFSILAGLVFLYSISKKLS